MSVIPIQCAGCKKVSHVTKTSSLFDLKQHELHAKNREYEAATTHAETHLLGLINAVENVRNVENGLGEWV